MDAFRVESIRIKVELDKAFGYLAAHIRPGRDIGGGQQTGSVHFENKARCISQAVGTRAQGNSAVYDEPLRAGESREALPLRPEITPRDRTQTC
jgi:hypothetical protein